MFFRISKLSGGDEKPNIKTALLEHIQQILNLYIHHTGSTHSIFKKFWQYTFITKFAHIHIFLRKYIQQSENTVNNKSITKAQTESHCSKKKLNTDKPKTIDVKTKSINGILFCKLRDESRHFCSWKYSSLSLRGLQKGICWDLKLWQPPPGTHDFIVVHVSVNRYVNSILYVSSFSCLGAKCLGWVREAYFLARLLEVAEMDGRAGAAPQKTNKRETARKCSAWALDDQKCSKIACPKNTQFSLPRNERAGWREEKKPSLSVNTCIWIVNTVRTNYTTSQQTYSPFSKQTSEHHSFICGCSYVHRETSIYLPTQNFARNLTSYSALGFGTERFLVQSFRLGGYRTPFRDQSPDAVYIRDLPKCGICWWKLKSQSITKPKD